MKYFILTLCCSFILLNNSLTASGGVICDEGSYPVTINAVTCCQETIDDAMTFTFWDGDEMVVFETITFSGAPATYVHEFCVPAGCYTVQCDYSTMNASHFQSITFNSDYFHDLNINETLENLPWNFEVCVGSEECHDVTLTAMSNVTANGPTGGVATIWNTETNEILAFEQFEWSEEIETNSFSVCLPDGCYEVVVDGDCCINYGVNYSMQVAANDAEASLSEFDANDNVSGFFTLSVNAACGQNDCPSEIWSGEGNECGVMNFEIGSFVQGEEVVWFPGDNSGPIISGHFLAHTFDQPGEYQVCAFYTSDACPEGVDLCTTVTVEPCAEECTPIELNITSLVENNGPPSGVLSIWNPQTQEMVSFHSLDWSMENPTQTLNLCLPDGCYEVVVDGDCCIQYGTNYSITANTASSASVTVSSFNANDAISGSLNLGVNSDCNSASTECPDALQAITTDTCGLIHFELNQSAADETVTWSTDDGSNTITGGHFLAHTFDQPGEYQVCAFYTSNACPEGVELCTTVTVEPCAEECTTVHLTLQNQSITNGSSNVHWSLLNSNQQTLEQGVAQLSSGQSMFENNFCLPDGCYTLIVEGLGVASDVFHSELEYLDQSLIQQVEVINENLVHITFGVHSNCSVAQIESTSLHPWAIYPNPASEFLEIHAVSQLPIHEIMLMDIHGKTLMIRHPQAMSYRLSVTDIPAGIYWLRVTDAFTSSMHQIIIQ